MANCAVYFNSTVGKVHSLLVYEKGPIYLADSDIIEIELADLETLCREILKRLQTPNKTISDQEWFDKAWVTEKRKRWLKAIKVKSLNALSAEFQLIEFLPKSHDETLVVPTQRAGTAFLHQAGKIIKTFPVSTFMAEVAEMLRQRLPK